MEISLCMIVRNESEHLARCLSSVKAAVDEIIIVDTGSTDDTKAIASGFTDKIYDFVWCDDFSAARNAAFGYAEKPFLMWLDADDVIEPEALQKLLALKERLDARVNAVMMPYQCGRRADGSPSMVFDRERIIRRGAGLRFSGVVHEAIVLHGNVIREDIPVRHMGDHGKESSARNLRIYEKTMAAGHVMTPRDQYYYARELMACGETVRAEQAFALFLHMDGWLPNVIDAHVQRGICLKRLGRLREAKLSYLAAMSRGIPRAEALCAMGEALLEEDDAEAAAFWYRAALALELPPSDGAFLMEDAYRYIPAIQLCVCYDRMGEPERAKEMNSLALSYHPGDAAGLQNQAYFERKLSGQGQTACKDA